MTQAPPEAAPRDAPQQPSEQERPALRVVDPNEPAPQETTEVEPEAGSEQETSEAESIEEDDGIAPDAPWQYRLGQAVADASDALPGLWSNRPASFAERVDYSMSADWTTAEAGQSGKRALHLIATIPLLAVDGLLLTPLRFCCEKNARFYLLLAALLILGYAL